MFILYSFILFFHINLFYFFEFNLILRILCFSSHSVLLEEFAENLEPIAVEDVHAAKEIAEKWPDDRRTKFIFHGPNLVNKNGQEVASGVKPDTHSGNEYYSSGGVIIGLCQSFREVASYVSNIMKKSNDCSSFPKIEHIATSKQVECYNVMQRHLKEIVPSYADKMVDQATNVITHGDQKIFL